MTNAGLGARNQRVTAGRTMSPPFNRGEAGPGRLPITSKNLSPFSVATLWDARSAKVKGAVTTAH
jgi:hypothetical protein